MTLVHGLLEASASRTPDATALIHGGRTASYAELNRLANRFAHVWRDAGVNRHDRVIVALDNSIEMVAAYVGAMKAGAAAVPLPAGPRSDRLIRATEDSAPAAAVIDAASAQEVDSANPLSAVGAVLVAGRMKPGQQLPSGFRTVADALRDAPETPVPVRPIDVDLAAIIYTSGSTGEPRGVMLTHRNVVANTRSIISYLSLTSRDRVMCVLPFYYVYGLSLLHTHLAVGGSVVIDNRFVFPNVVLDGMRQHEVTGFAGVPSTFALLLHRSNIQQLTFPNLRYVTQAGGSMPASRIAEWLEQGPQVPFYVMYGATEAAARLTFLDPSSLRAKAGSIGRPVPNVEIVIIRDDGTPAPPGETGELVARGANIARGYWNNPEETREKFGPRGYHTGDLGYADADGNLFLIGRRHDMIKVGAHRVGGKEIEEVLHQHPGVLEAAVIAIPHEILGEVPLAVVVAAPAAQVDAETLRNLCHQRLAAHKVPVRFEFVAELPKIPGVGKIDKVALRAAFTGDGAVRLPV